MRALMKKLGRRHRRSTAGWGDRPLPMGPVRFDPIVRRAGEAVSPPAA